MNRMWRLSLLWLLVGAQGAYAQTRPMAFERVSLEQGLSQSTVLSMFQDSRGFMWFGTEDGLNRYDGVTFKTYKYDSGRPRVAPQQHGLGDRRGRGGRPVGSRPRAAACRPLGPCARPLRARRRLRHARALQPRPHRCSSSRTARSGSAASDAGLVRFQPRTGEFKAFRNDPGDATSLGHDGVYALADDGKGGLWVGTDGGLDRMDTATGRFERFRHDAREARQPGRRPRARC